MTSVVDNTLWTMAISGFPLPKMRTKHPSSGEENEKSTLATIVIQAKNANQAKKRDRQYEKSTLAICHSGIFKFIAGAPASV